MGLVKTRRLAAMRPPSPRLPPSQGYGGRDGGLKAGMRMKVLPKVTSGKGVYSPSRKQADALTSALRSTT